jgi:hypothetical protein
VPLAGGLVFLAYLAAPDTLIEQATKAEIAEVARVLALYVAHYRQRYGDVSVEESLEMLRTEKITDEIARNLADGCGVSVEVLKALGRRRGAPSALLLLRLTDGA